MQLKINDPELGNQDPEGQIWCVFTYIWILALKSMIRKLQSGEQLSNIEHGTREHR